MPKKKKLGRRR
jgi:hypothetical protein